MNLDNLQPVNDKLKDISNRFRRKPLRNAYMARFVIRCIIYVLSLVLYFTVPSQFEIVTNPDWGAFFHSFTFAHVVWIVWIIDMVAQLIPLRRYIPIGSQKNFRLHYLPALEKVNKERFIAHIKGITVAAYKVFALWAALIIAIGILYKFRLIEGGHLYLFAVTFYVCDLICVLFWCPFRVFIMKNKCCTTCRIFNWDHLMMFSPLIYIMRSFYAFSLAVVAIIIWAAWEISFLVFPERFTTLSNRSLKCSECRDRLCRKPRGDRGYV